MMNDKFEPIHLTERKVTTPLFHNAKEALGGSDARKQPIKYLVIESTTPIPEALFFNAPICPVFIHRGRSYILLEGESLSSYFLAHRQKDIVLTEQEIWRLLTQIGKALAVLQGNGKEHVQLREYAIRRVNADNFRLVYHPEMCSAVELMEENLAGWFQFYFAPEQLGNFTSALPNSCVFSLAAMVLTIMNPLDSKRDIYSQDKFELNPKVIEEKLKNAGSGFYSNRLVDIVRFGLTPQPSKRPSLEEFLKLLAKYDPISRKNKQIESWKQGVTARLSKSKEKKQSENKQSSPKAKPPSPPKEKKEAPQQTVSMMINFERGTFGGQVEDDVDQEQQQSITSSQQVQMTYNEYHQKNKEGSSSKKVEKSPSSPISPIYKYPDEESTITRRDDDVRYQQKQKQVLAWELGEFNQRICEYHIKLSECLQPLPDLIKLIGVIGIQSDEDIYYGGMTNGRRNGVGLSIFPKGEYYYGHFKDDLFHGEGFYFWHNSQYFLGLWEAGSKVEGTWQGKAKYVGQIKRNRRHGIGSCFYPSGRVYEGEWFEGKYEGSGIMSEPCGEKFIGLWRAGRKWGKGCFLAEKCRITGVWNGDEAVGSVEITYENGNIYVGSINNDFEKHGQGQYRFKNGVVCKGVFENDDFLHGEIRYKNGQRYVGELKEYRRHGMGKYYYANGRVGEGRWIDGRLEEATINL